MKTISLKEFIVTGDFGGVTIGTSKSELFKLLGETDEINDYENGSGGIFYGYYELFFDTKTEKITGIQNDHLLIWPKLKRKNRIEDHKEAIYFENDTCKMDTWFLQYGKNLTYNEILKTLENESIEFKEIYDIHCGCRIEFKSGVTMDFSDFDDDWFINQTIPDKRKLFLNGIRLFEK